VVEKHGELRLVGFQMIPMRSDPRPGPAGVCLAAGTGIMRVMPGKEEVLADVIPIDVVANFTLAVPWYLTYKGTHFKVRML
jgi:hypothetical protein